MATLFLISVLLATLVILPPCSNARAPRKGFAAAGVPGQFLGPHNAARSSIGLPPLAWDPRLARYAEQYTRRRRSDCALVHSNGPYGENIFWGSGTGWSPAQAVAAWVGERRWYRYGTNTCAAGDNCGHYTQIVWSGTKSLGCAMVTCSGGRGQFVVCNYDPPGNYVGEKPY